MIIFLYKYYTKKIFLNLGYREYFIVTIIKPKARGFIVSSFNTLPTEKLSCRRNLQCRFIYLIKYSWDRATSLVNQSAKVKVCVSYLQSVTVCN